MADFDVKLHGLRRYGHHYQSFADDIISVTVSRTKVECRANDSFNGLLTLVKPVVDELAEDFGNHYEKLQKVVHGTGVSLVSVADHYAKQDEAAAAAADAGAPRVGHQHDTPIGNGGGPFQATYPMGQCYGASPDPSQEIRDDMDVDVKAIDWVFHKFTGHHITEPIDDVIGNWTALTACANTWGDIHDALDQHGEDLLANRAVVDAVWDGNAAMSFKEYGTRLGNGFKGEAAAPAAIKLAMKEAADEWEKLYKQAVDLLQSVIHDVEVGAGFLAAAWWCGAGEAVAAKKCEEALVAFYRAYKIAKAIHQTITGLNVAVKGLKKLAKLDYLIHHIPGTIDQKIQEIKDQIGDYGDLATALLHLGDAATEPTKKYGGPNDPGIS
ncbi:hypothetical protein AB3X52_11685 [Nocardioides sp. DS6]|uniref:WXG100 family type VII secretion target n=1 Tax=Nocardioides eburneus TaxID=3231482 RepID=A0ABV3SZB2_9ACTN